MIHLFLFNVGYSFAQWFMIVTATIIIGMSKAGIRGIDMLNVTLMALVFGGKASTGVVLPLLCMADVLAVIYYKRHVQWTHFWRLIPPMFVGVLIGAWWAKDVDELFFKKIMSIIIISTLIIMLWIENKKKLMFPQNLWFSTTMGLVSGLATMLGNLAGAFSNVYFLALRVSKNEFIGTAAWIFLVINLSKVPLQLFVWKNINFNTLLTDLILLPAVFFGFFVGKKIVGKINENVFRKLIMILTFIGSLLIFII
jgi:uncharacterized protein